MKIIFKLEEFHYNKGTYMISVNSDKLDFKSMCGSWNVLPARLLNLKYADYLRMCRDVYGATYDLSGGRKGTYWLPRFSDKKKANELVNLLNKIINEVEKEEIGLNFK